MSGDDGVSRRAVLGGVAGAVAATGGCLVSGRRPEQRAGDWPQRGYDAGGTNLKTEGDPPLDDAVVAWQTDLPDGWSNLQSPWTLLAGGTAFTPGGEAIDVTDGSVSRRTACLSELKGFARTRTYSDGVLLASGRDRGPARRTFESPVESLHGFRPSVDTGTPSRCANGVRWTIGAPNDIDMLAGPTVVSDGRVLVASAGSEDRLYSVKPEDGRVQWTTSLDNSPFAGRKLVVGTQAGLLADSDTVYLYHKSPPESEDVFWVLDRETREHLYERRPANGGWLHAVRDGIAYLVEYETTEEGRLGEQRFAPVIRAVDPGSASVLWSVNVEDLTGQTVTVDRTDPPGDVASPSVALAVGPETVFGAVRGTCFALSVPDRRVRWRRRIVSGLIAATEQAVYTTVRPDGFACLDAATGETRWEITFDSVDYLGKPTIGDTRIVVPLGRNRLVALEEP